MVFLRKGEQETGDAMLSRSVVDSTGLRWGKSRTSELHDQKIGYLSR